MRHLPAFLSVRGQTCLVVGGGTPAAAKVRLLRRSGAAVTVIAPGLGSEIAALANAGEVRVIRRASVDGDVAGCTVVFAASGAAEVDRHVAAAAHRAGVPVNVVDRPDLSSFITPAIVDRDPVVVAISTGGAAPVLARRLRAALERRLPAGLGRLARFAEMFRGAVKATLPSPLARRRFWEHFFDGPLAEAVLTGDERGARERMLALVNRPAAAARPQGAVAIVGAGPGDPELLTLRATRLLQEADVVLYDRLIGPGILDHARRDAERIYVGKAPSAHVHTQDEINDLMAAHAAAGRRVVRLKGGDPFVFGRGGEEVDHLRRRGVAVEVVPGITAATGCAALAGIPLTHRDHASALTFVTGHGQAGAPEPDWRALARARHTLVIYMGWSSAGAIARRLIAHGMAPDTPAAVVENGTRPEQKLVTATVATLARTIAGAGIVGPALIVVGEVVRLSPAAALAAAAQAEGAA
jgi:uroporphyrin-III C-methyltransferase/precorrin-2 dehydrogenase/sirohydrochlorin ferrochelatase